MKRIKENIGYVLFVLAYIGVCALLMYLAAGKPTTLVAG